VRVVLDTNVVMSALFFGGIPGVILSHWSNAGFELVLSIFQEYERVARELGAEKVPDPFSVPSQIFVV
jgi:uncharacterized protein